MRVWGISFCVAALVATFGCGKLIEESEPLPDVGGPGHATPERRPGIPPTRALPCDDQKLASSKSLAGCHFFLASLPAGCVAVLVTNVSDSPAALRLRFNGNTSDDVREVDATQYAYTYTSVGGTITRAPLGDKGLEPGRSALVSALTLNEGTAICPTPTVFHRGTGFVANDVVTPTVELLSDTPIVATQTSPTRSSAGQPRVDAVFPLFPLHGWGTGGRSTGIFAPRTPNLVREWAFVPGNEDDEDDEGAYGWFRVVLDPVRTTVIAALDDTRVVLTTPDGTVQRRLDRGQVYTHVTHDAEIGLPFTADKPVALVSSTFGALLHENMDFSLGSPDSARASTQALPTLYWTSEYVAVGHGDRWPDLPEAPLWRVVGGADGTTLTYEPAVPAGAPTHLAAGQLAQFRSPEPFTVRSQDAAHAFYMGGTMSSSAYLRETNGLGGPPASNDRRGGPVSYHVLGRELWSSRYALHALTNGGSEQSIVVVRRGGGAPVSLSCAGGALQGWKPVGNGFEYLRVALTDRGQGVAYPGGQCTTGSHQLWSTEPFGATLWGWGRDDAGTEGAYALPLRGVPHEVR